MRFWKACKAFWATLHPKPTHRWLVQRLAVDGSVAQEWWYRTRDEVDERMRHESEKGFLHEVRLES